MKKILVPVDFSENTWSVCKFATLVSRHDHAEIKLFHSYFDQVIVTDSSFPTGIDTETMINEQLLRDIKIRSHAAIVSLQGKLMEYLKKEKIANTKVIFTLEGGEPEYAIMETARDYQPDYIVMGTSGSGNKGFLEGSVSRRVMNHADVPVFALPEMESIPVINNILYVSEIHENDISVLNALFDILEPFNISVHFLHILVHEDLEEAEKRLEPVRKYFSEQERQGSLSYHLKKETDIQEDVENFIREKDISMISFIPHKKSFISRLFSRTLTKKDLLQMNTPLLALKP